MYTGFLVAALDFGFDHMILAISLGGTKSISNQDQLSQLFPSMNCSLNFPNFKPKVLRSDFSCEFLFCRRPWHWSCKKKWPVYQGLQIFPQDHPNNKIKVTLWEASTCPGDPPSTPAFKTKYLARSACCCATCFCSTAWRKHAPVTYEKRKLRIAKPVASWEHQLISPRQHVATQQAKVAVFFFAARNRVALMSSCLVLYMDEIHPKGTFDVEKPIQHHKLVGHWILPLGNKCRDFVHQRSERRSRSNGLTMRHSWFFADQKKWCRPENVAHHHIWPWFSHV